MSDSNKVIFNKKNTYNLDKKNPRDYHFDQSSIS